MAYTLAAVVTMLLFVSGTSGTHTYFLSGTRGNFSYPVDGFQYRAYERILILVEITQTSVFTLEKFDLEYDTCWADTLTFSKWEGDRFVQTESWCGPNAVVVPKHNLVDRSFLLAFSTDQWPDTDGTGIRISWGPITAQDHANVM